MIRKYRNGPRNDSKKGDFLKEEYRSRAGYMKQPGPEFVITLLGND